MLRRDLLFFAGGFAGLVYQVAWARLVTRSVGADVLGVSLVVATFMGGMALGAPLGARLTRLRADRAFALVVALGALGAVVSAFTLGFPAGDERALDALRSVALLAPSTLAMGATFPLMGRLTPPEGGLGARTGDFYGANTLGAALGALAAGFLVLPTFGLRGAILFGAAVDLAVAAGALLLFRTAAPGDRAGSVHDGARGAEADHARAATAAAGGPARAPTLRARSAAGGARAAAAVGGGPAVLSAGPVPARPVLLALAALGASSLALEVVLTRVVIGLTGASVFAFALVLAAYLAGLGLGARQARSWLERVRDPLDVLARTACAAVGLTCLGLLALRLQVGVDDPFAPLANRTPTRGGVVGLWVSQAVLAALALVPPAAAFGFALPAGLAALARPDADEPRLVARAYAWNTFGSALGAVGAAWWLLPTFGARGASAAALGLAAVPVAIALAVPRRTVGAAAALPRLSRATLGTAAVAAGLGLVALAPRGSGEFEVVARSTGAVSTAVVERPADDPDGLALRIDGKVVASSALIDLRLQRLLAAVPATLHGDVDTAAVIGLGMGTTAGTLAALEGLERLRVVELSDAVVAVVAAFEPWTGPLLEDPRLRLERADGRAWTARSARPGGPRFDLVTADPIHPWTRGSSDLYALEHFERLRALLAPGGVASQWLPLYQLSTADVRTVAATWCAAFPHTSAWLTAYDLVLVGSNDPPRPRTAWVDAPLPAGLARDLEPLGIDSGSDLAALQVADDATLRAFAGGAEPMREDRPSLEFSAPRSFLRGYSEEALRWAGSALPVEALPASSRAEARRVRALLDEFLDAASSDWARAARAYGERLRTGAAPGATSTDGL